MFVMTNNAGIKIHHCKQLIDKGVFNKELIWNPYECECDKACECDKVCKIGEYLSYEKCNWRTKLVGKLVDECNKTVEEVTLGKITNDDNGNSYKCSSCTVYNVLFSIFFTINVSGIGAYFLYFHWYLKKMFTREATIY